jgi:hypothetical protein
MKKKEWGNAVWYLFHTLAEKLKPEYNNETVELFKQISKICNNLPCPDCQTHAMEVINRHNRATVSASKENLIVFLWRFHNSVNKRTGAPEFSREAVDAKYKLANTQQIIQYFINIMNKADNNSKSMLNSFHRQLYIKQFTTYISANIYKYNP